MRSTRRLDRARRWRKTNNGDDGRGAHPEEALQVMLLKSHADLEPVGEANPVERLLHFRQHAGRGPILRLVGPADPLLDAAVAEIGEKASGIPGDVANLNDLDRLYEAVKRYGRKIDVIFANAGVARLAPFGTMDELDNTQEVRPRVAESPGVNNEFSHNSF
jgi:hypothetical protein